MNETMESKFQNWELFINWASELGTGVLASLIASVIFIIITGIVIWNRKSQIKIKNSDVGGDVIQGNKNTLNSNSSFLGKEKSDMKISDSRIKGDIIQGDKKEYE